MVDIVERLRQKAHEMPLPPTRELREAADEIERLREQERKMTNHALERMEEIERLREEHHDVRILNEQYFNENAILIDEIERLREAHEKIIAMANKPNKRIRDAVVISQAALQQKDSE